MEKWIHVTTETSQTLPEPKDPNREPIINSPYGIPDWRWQLDTSTKAYAPALPGRRESQNIPPVAGSRKLQGTPALPGEMGARWTPLQLVNDIRAAVLNWQDEGYPGITRDQPGTHQPLDGPRSTPETPVFSPRSTRC